MPALVKFKSVKTYEIYNALTAKDASTLYFCEDQGRLFKGTTEFTSYIKSVTFIGEGNVVSGASITTNDDGQLVLTLNKGFTAADAATVNTHVANKSNPHGVTAAQVGTYTTAQIDEMFSNLANQGATHIHTEGQTAAMNSGITAEKVGSYDAHVADGNIHVTTQDKAKWNNKQDALTEAQIHSHDNKSELDKIADGDKAKWDAEIGANDAAKKAQGDIDTHSKNGDIHVTADDKSKWNTAADNVDTLIGDDKSKSVRAIAAEEIAAQLITDDAKESLDTLGEIAAWIQSHPDDASAMNEAIVALQKKLSGIDEGEGTVKKYIDGAITALNMSQYALASDLLELADRVGELEAKVDVTKVSTAISESLAEAKSYTDDALTWEEITEA